MVHPGSSAWNVAGRRTLVVQTAFVGDIVLTTPLLRELRRLGPRDHLCVLTSEAGGELLRGLGFVDEVLVLQKRWNRAGLASYLRVLRHLRQRPFDVAIAAHRSFRSGVLGRVSGATQRIGFAGAPGAWAYGTTVHWKRADHATRRYLALAGPLGSDPAGADSRPELAVDPAAASRVERLLGSSVGADLICIAPGSNRATKRWLPEGFAQVASSIAASGLRPVIVGAPGEVALCAEVARRSGGDVPVLAGRIGLPELVALVSRARAVVANDSGTAHVASAFDVPVVSVFGPTSPAFGYVAHGPRTFVAERKGLDCRPCSVRGPASCPQGHFRCMRELPSSHVLGLLDGALRDSAPTVLRDQPALPATVLPG